MWRGGATAASAVRTLRSRLLVDPIHHPVTSLAPIASARTSSSSSLRPLPWRTPSWKKRRRRRRLYPFRSIPDPSPTRCGTMGSATGSSRKPASDITRIGAASHGLLLLYI
ncbi:unnamed protein product [Miscanthus lutarioriparius]|uniref:Uncharacterized protein n=1 Tax=Miscanthus lutarioriparius TaxID=422564 RepID=A0A811MSJ8_9POAL|nr:unnamed protein product [Miscanthus lutarioriparius]